MSGRGVKFDPRPSRHSRRSSIDQHRGDSVPVPFGQNIYSTYDDEFRALQADRDRWHVKVKSLDKQLRESEARHRALTSRIENLEEDNKRLSEDAKHLQKEKKELQDQVAALREELDRIHTKPSAPALNGSLAVPEQAPSASDRECMPQRSSSKRDKGRDRESPVGSRSRNSSRARDNKDTASSAASFSSSSSAPTTTTTITTTTASSHRSREAGDAGRVRESSRVRETRQARDAREAAEKEKAKLAERFQRSDESDTKSTSTKSSRSSRHHNGGGSLAVTKPVQSQPPVPYVEPFGPATHHKMAPSSTRHYPTYPHALPHAFGAPYPPPTHEIEVPRAIRPSVHLLDVEPFDSGTYYSHPQPKDKSARSRN